MRKKHKHKYIFQLKGNRFLLDEYNEFACMICGLNWRFDKTKTITNLRYNRFYFNRLTGE